MIWLRTPDGYLHAPGRHRALLRLTLLVSALHGAIWMWLREDEMPGPSASVASTSNAPAPTALATRSLAAPPAPAARTPQQRTKPGPTARPARMAVPTPAVEAAPPGVQADAALVDASPVPIYATRFAPASVLNYQLRRGPELGTATLSWQPNGADYEVRLDRSLAGRSLQSWVSSGGFDAAGLAPQRQIDERRGRPKAATNFQRAAGIISFSASTLELPLPPGAQDRVSWILQLSAIVAAGPQAFMPGQIVQLPVAAVQGRVDVWTFVVQAFEPLDLPAGHVATALRLQRQPEALYEPRTELWLDPQRHYLPVRLRWSRTTGEPALEMNLETQSSEP